MYQINIKVNEKRAFWIYALNKIIGSKVKEIGGIAAVASLSGQTGLGLACNYENRDALDGIIRDGLVELLETIGKMCYIDDKLSRLNINSATYRLLLHTLVAFDRERERDLILEIIGVSPTISLDGIYNFKLAELKDRWDEICALITGNSSFLYDELTLNELLRFLVSAINPKIMKLELCRRGDEFLLTGRHNDTEFRMATKGGDNLMLYLIDLAPIELEINGDLSDDKLYCRLVEVFDAKTKDKIQNSVTN